MPGETSKSFDAASLTSPERITAAIRNPEQEFLTDNYVHNRSQQVADIMLQLARAGEGAAVAHFIAAKAERADALAEKGQTGRLMDILEALDKPNQVKMLGATEAYLYGTPNATVLQAFVRGRDKKIVDRLTEVFRGFDTEQRTQVMMQPGAMWWMSAFDQLPLLYAVVESLSKPQRQKVLNSHMAAHALQCSCWGELTDLFKGCKFPKHAEPPKP